MKELTKEQALKSRNTVVAVSGDKFYCDLTATDYPSTKNKIGVSAYPIGFGCSVFLPENTRFFEGGEYQRVQSLAEEVKENFKNA